MPSIVDPLRPGKLTLTANNPSVRVYSCGDCSAARKIGVIVYSRDHPPPHVHVVTPNGQAKVPVHGRNGHPTLVWNLGLARRDLAAALAAIEEHRKLILAEWDRIHE